MDIHTLSTSKDHYSDSLAVYSMEGAGRLELSVWVKAAQQPSAQIAINWEADGSFVTQTLSDADGRASFSLIFELGQHEVTARLAGRESSVSFEVVVYPKLHFDLRLEGLLPPEPNPVLLGRDNTYYLIVKVVTVEGEAVPGIKFTLSAPRTCISYIQIDPENVEIESSVEGSRFLIRPQRYILGTDAQALDTRLKVLLTSNVGISAERVYLVGRLVRWQSGLFSRTTDNQILLELQAEWVAEGGSDPNYFNWPPRFTSFTVSLPALGNHDDMLATEENPPAVNWARRNIDFPLAPGPTTVEVAEKMIVRMEGFLYSFPFSIELDVPPES